MWNIKEEDLDKFRMTCNDRLSPEGATGFMFGGILYSSIAVFSIIVSGDWDYCMVLLNIGIVKLEVLLYALQVIFFILYLFPKATNTCRIIIRTSNGYYITYSFSCF